MEASSKDKGKGKMTQSAATLPSIDWRKEGVLNECRNQGRPPVCWAIVACEAIESLYNIMNQPNDLFQLAPQELIDCVQKGATKCYTTTINEGFRYAKQYGIRAEEDSPYKGLKQTCKSKLKDKAALKIKNFKNIHERDEERIIEALKKQPIAAAVLFTKELQQYKEGIFEGPVFFGEDYKSTGHQLHAILIVGCGTDEVTGKNYWIIQNSWGTEWGLKGFAKIIRNSSLAKGRLSSIFRVSYPETVEYFKTSGEQDINFQPKKQQ